MHIYIHAYIYIYMHMHIYAYIYVWIYASRTYRPGSQGGHLGEQIPWGAASSVNLQFDKARVSPRDTHMYMYMYASRPYRLGAKGATFENSYRWGAASSANLQFDKARVSPRETGRAPSRTDTGGVQLPRPICNLTKLGLVRVIPGGHLWEQIPVGCSFLGQFDRARLSRMIPGGGWCREGLCDVEREAGCQVDTGKYREQFCADVPLGSESR